MKCSVGVVKSDLRDNRLVLGIHNLETPLWFENHFRTSLIQNTCPRFSLLALSSALPDHGACLVQATR